MLYDVVVTCDILETVDASSREEAMRVAIEVMKSKMKYVVMKVSNIYVSKT